MVTFVRYSYITWNPPVLSAQEELDLGKRIALVGRDQFEKEFRESIKYANRKSKRPKTGIASWPEEVRYTILILFFGGMLLFLAKAGIANQLVMSFVPIMVVVALLYYASIFFAIRRFKGWVDHLIANYAKHMAKGAPMNDRTSFETRNSTPIETTAYANVEPQNSPEQLSIALEYFNKGVKFATGQGVSQNYSEALKWYMKSATLGSGLPDAQTNLGTMYSNGQGVERDFTESVQWFLKAAKQGEQTAQYNLGLFYAQGLGVKQDYVEAVRWSRKSAEQGNVGAMNNLGVFYLKGMGVPQSEEEGLRLLRKAADGGYEIAKNALKALDDARADQPPMQEVLDENPRIEKLMDSATGLIRYKHRQTRVTEADDYYQTEETRIRITMAVSPGVSFDEAQKQSLSFNADISQAKRGTHYDGVTGVNGIIIDYCNEYIFPTDGSRICIGVTKKNLGSRK